MTKATQVTHPVTEFLDFGNQFAKGLELLSEVDKETVQVGITPKEKVANFDKVELYRYQSLTDKIEKTQPVLIVYGLIGRYTMIDLQEDRSLVRGLLKQDVDLYVVDWGYPSRADQYMSFDDYVAYYMDECVEHICQEHGLDSITVFGICEGGTFSAMYAAHKPEKVKNLILSITPIDFAASSQDENPHHGFLNLWINSMDDKTIEDLIDSCGNLPGEFIGSVFNAMTPVRSMTKYNIDLVNIAKDQAKLLNFLRMEKWLSDRPHHPGVAAKQWLIDLYKKNYLVKGEFELDGKKLDLKKLTMPVLNIYAERDHIIPPPCSFALKEYVGSEDYTDLPLSGGHVGIYVSSKLQGLVANSIHDWLRERQ